MAKLLPTRLPLAEGENVSAELFNRLVRILEINLGAVDPDNTLQLSTAQRDKLNFNLGTLIFNTTTQVLQVFNGTEFIDLIRKYDGVTSIHDFGSDELAENYIDTTFILLRKYISLGELEDLRTELPKNLKSMIYQNVMF